MLISFPVCFNGGNSCMQWTTNSVEVNGKVIHVNFEVNRHIHLGTKNNFSLWISEWYSRWFGSVILFWNSDSNASNEFLFYWVHYSLWGAGGDFFKQTVPTLKAPTPACPLKTRELDQGVQFYGHQAHSPTGVVRTTTLPESPVPPLSLVLFLPT